MTDQEIIEALREITGFSILKGELVFARKLKAAAERIRVLGEEVEAWRRCPQDHFARVWDQPQMSGLHRSEQRQGIIDARAATDAARGGTT